MASRVPRALTMHVRLATVDKRFAARPVLRQVELDVASGEFVAVIGASGSGKSTLLRLLAGLDACDGGAVLLDGEPLRGLNRAARVMFQEARLLPWRRVADNVRLVQGAEARGDAAALLELVGLADRAGDWPATLSGGQRQRVALARALASAPRLLLLDEPLGALDALTRVEMQHLIEAVWRRHHCTTVLVTHDCTEAVALADRVAVLDAGRLATQIAVSLPRPRDRSDPRFAALVGRVLEHIAAAVPAGADPVASTAPESSAVPTVWALPASLVGAAGARARSPRWRIRRGGAESEGEVTCPDGTKPRCDR